MYASTHVKDEQHEPYYIYNRIRIGNKIRESVSIIDQKSVKKKKNHTLYVSL